MEVPWWYVPGIIGEVILFFYIVFVISALVDDAHIQKHGF